ncbi:hypothetical protein EI94DRAFT_1786258 [Lactarius quietus]|nr:hypothetical protein EI94DRAFT_1786258 [Lactarius quietus]
MAHSNAVVSVAHGQWQSTTTCTKDDCAQRNLQLAAFGAAPEDGGEASGMAVKRRRRKHTPVRKMLARMRREYNGMDTGDGFGEGDSGGEGSYNMVQGTSDWLRSNVAHNADAFGAVVISLATRSSSSGVSSTGKSPPFVVTGDEGAVNSRGLPDGKLVYMLTLVIHFCRNIPEMQPWRLQIVIERSCGQSGSLEQPSRALFLMELSDEGLKASCFDRSLTLNVRYCWIVVLSKMHRQVTGHWACSNAKLRLGEMTSLVPKGTPWRMSQF